MAIRWAIASGNWSNPAIWDGGTLPADGDDVYADGKTVTIDQDINVGSLNTVARIGGTAGGVFSVSVDSGQTRTITCTGPAPNVVAGTTNCITISSPPGGATVITNCSPKGGEATFIYGIYKNSPCIYQHNGNCYTGTTNRTAGLVVNGGSSNTIIGNGYGTTGGTWASSNSGAISLSGAGVVAVVTGDVYSGASYGLHVLGGATCTLNGNIYANGTANGGYIYGASTLTVNGNIYGHATSSVDGCRIDSDSELIILNGNAIAQAGIAISGYLGGRVRANGDLVPSDSNFAVHYVKLELNGTAYISTNGWPAFGGLRAFGISSGFNAGIKVKYYDAVTNALGTEDTLSTSTVYGNLYPPESHVRNGVSYGPANQWTGTAHIPAPASVAYGVPVDNTTGTAALTPADVWSYSSRALTDKTGFELTPSYDRAKTALASTEYIAPDNTGIAAINAQTDRLQFNTFNRVLADAVSTVDTDAIADAVWDEARAGHNVSGSFGAVSEWSGGATPQDVWSYATRTLTSASSITTDNQPIDQSIIANLDVPVSSRLASTAYTVPDNTGIAAINAQTDRLQFNTFNRVLADAVSTVDTGAIADAVWDEARAGHNVSGSFGAVSEWASASTGAGARTIVVTVREGANPLESATVRFTKGAESYSGKTNASGTVTFYVDDGTWQVVATLHGYAGTSTAHIVDTTQSPLTISLTKITLSSSPPGTVTGYSVVIDEAGNPKDNVVCTSQLIRAPDGSGVVGDTDVLSSVSDASGVVQFVGLLPGGQYRFARGKYWTVITVPLDAPSTWQIPNFAGSP